MKTWTTKYETMTGTVKVAKVKAKTASEAVDVLVKEVRVGNLLEVKDSKGVRWV
jgi:hypothetical protein